MIELSKTYPAWFLLSVHNSFKSNPVEMIQHQAKSRNFCQKARSRQRKSLHHPVFAENLGSTMASVVLRDMQNRLVDYEKFSAQRCFYHDAVLPINEKSGMRSHDARIPAATARWAQTSHRKEASGRLYTNDKLLGRILSDS